MNPEQEESITTETMNEEAAQAAHDHTEDTSASENAAAESGEGNTSSSEGAVEDAELAKAKAEAEEYQQRYLRAQADFDNFRRRTLKEKEDFAKYASAKLVTELLPVLDNFERALATEQASSEAESFIKGVDMIFRQLGQVLEQEGVKPMEAVGQPFNPEFHQAVMTVDTDEYEEGVVVEELQKGYMLKDKVLRPAMVKVSG
ncbi:nucleotide exchange factor GrpE [Paenibacillus alvei]|nr:nucleotide exchange factor GrpE [Paenibacillus alvei]EJW17335.1 molecular chaperone GrpE [Paenibacillus alvei DSM 29]MCY9540101.1 nucleotide exchange factor GrpE [Paenibacillus alvei]MCY9705691.1 nucleotide exchange factor GrpE [Paenibacillus alvei]MCY9734925.1 nucleotide exchange factor GrpE [Paenibacillus alvei]MCY9757788.1 nucleotide exchange factor GrpE [Paenibacillus alvei]